MTTRTTVVDGVNELEAALADDRAFELAASPNAAARVFVPVAPMRGDVTLAEELTQETFVAAIDRRSRFDGRSDVITWLCGIARHKLADHFRSLEREERRRMRIEIRQIEVDYDAPHRIDTEDRALIAEALRSLPASHRAVLVFVVLDDLPVAEAARLLGRSRGATELLLFRARESFRRAYAAQVEP